MWRLHPYNVPGIRRIYFAWLNRCPLCLIYPTHGKERRQW